MPARTSAHSSDEIGREPLKARVTSTETGYPVTIERVREVYGKTASKAVEEGWFWIFATRQAAKDIRRRGLHVVGEELTTWVPPQSRAVVDESVSEADVPVVGSPEHTALMLEETGEGSGHFYAEAPESPSGPLRKVIVHRLRRAVA